MSEHKTLDFDCRLIYGLEKGSTALQVVEQMQFCSIGNPQYAEDAQVSYHTDV